MDKDSLCMLGRIAALLAYEEKVDLFVIVQVNVGKCEAEVAVEIAFLFFNCLGSCNCVAHDIAKLEIIVFGIGAYEVVLGKAFVIANSDLELLFPYPYELPTVSWCRSDTGTSGSTLCRDASGDG